MLKTTMRAAIGRKPEAHVANAWADFSVIGHSVDYPIGIAMNAITSLAPVPSALIENPLGAFLAKASIEITGRQVDKVPLIVDLLPKGASVFVALIDAADLTGQITAVATLRKAGFNPIPHIPARFVRDVNDLTERLATFTGEAGVTDVLALGGGAPQPIGQFDAAIQI
jgi:methylenetetrahydrofolate reductase (NADPH)